MPRPAAEIPLLARRAELGALRDMLRRARSGRPGLVVLSGDAGVGKSRILAELTAEATAAGDLAIVGACMDTAEAALPYLPFVEVARQLVAEPDVNERYTALRRLVPENAEPDDAGELGQLQLFNTLHAALGHATEDRTVLLAVEDLHWADRSSRDLFAFLASRLSHQRLLLVGTYRSDDLHRRHPMRKLLTELVRLPHTERLHVEPFDRDDARSFVRALADEGLDEAAVSRIAEDCEGNAFIAEELVSASTSSAVPHGLAEVLLARVELLSDEAQQVMRLASVIGRRFGHQRLAAASDASSSALDDALREAVTRSVLVLDETGEDYAFRHALLREALYGDLLPGERSRMHRQVAASLAEADHVGAAAELAHHSMAGHDLTTALTASVRAVGEARELAAPAEALVHVERALQLWHSVPDAEQITGMSELKLTILAGMAAWGAGEPDRAIAHGRAAIVVADRLDDILSSAERRREYAFYLMRTEDTLEQAYRTVQEAWDMVSDIEPNEVKVLVQAGLARANIGIGQYERAADLAEQAIETSEAITGEGGHLGARADALLTRITMRDRRLLPTEEVLRLLDDVVELTDRADAPMAKQRALFHRAATLHDAGRFEEALAALDVVAAQADRDGLQWGEFALEGRVLEIITRFMIGDWEGAEAAADRIGDTVSGTVTTRISAPMLLLNVHRGEFEIADRRLVYLRDRLSTDQQVLTAVGAAWAELETWRGRPEAAITHVVDALDRLQKIVPGHLSALSLCAVGIAAAADSAARADSDSDKREAVAAGESFAAAAEHAMKHGRTTSRELGPEGYAWWRRVLAERTRLEGPGDAAAWRHAIEAFGYAEPYRVAQAQWRCAEALLAAGGPGDRAEARDLLTAAAETADRLGAAPLSAAVAGLSDRARLSSSGGEVSEATPLTPREQAVLELVAEGLTNRQVGARLFISEKTASVHLSRAMAKLSASSRAEAVSAAYLRGLLKPQG